MTLLSCILQRAAQKCPDAAAAACCACACPSTSFVDGGASSSQKTILSFRAAWQAQLEHRAWLERVVIQTLCSEEDKRRSRSQEVEDEEKEVDERRNNPRILIVYISSNQVDLFLSVLACLLLNAAADEDGDRRRRPLLVTLLNTRWTSVEMVAALQSSPGKGEDEEEEAIVLCYSSDLEAKALQTKALLPPHRCRGCLAIPQFAANKRFTTTTTACPCPRPIMMVPSTSPSSPIPSPVLTTTLEEAVRGEIQSIVRRYYNGKSSNNNQGTTKEDDDDEDAMILFTSGTSSRPKGVRLSHRAIYVQAVAKLLPPCSYSNRTVLLATSVPFFHIGGLSSILATWIAGGCLVVSNNSSSSSSLSSFDPNQTLRDVSSAHVNTLVVVPAMLYAIEEELLSSSTSSSSVRESRSNSNNDNNMTAAFAVYPEIRLILIGGQSASAKTLSFVKVTFPNARVVQTYACTEAASSLTFLEVSMTRITANTMPPLSSRVVGDCVGKPPDHVELALLDTTSSKDDDLLLQSLPSSFHGINNSISGSIIPKEKSYSYTVGVIATRGPHVMNGYWGGDASSTISSSSWFVTNDLGFWDEQGRLWICGRLTDSIRTGGETVLASEVERIVLFNPAVAECAVFGLPDDKFGQVVCCAIVVMRRRCRDHHDHQEEEDPTITKMLSLRDVRQWCEKHGLASYKRPRRVFHVDAIPKNSSGKPLKYRLVERFTSTTGTTKAPYSEDIPAHDRRSKL